MKLLSRLVFVPIALTVAVFAVANRQEVTLEMWPLPFAIDLPVYLAVLGAMAIGFLIGGSMQWAADSRWRRRARADRRRARALARTLADRAEPPPETAPPPPAAAEGVPPRTRLPRRLRLSRFGRT